MPKKYRFCKNSFLLKSTSIDKSRCKKFLSLSLAIISFHLLFSSNVFGQLSGTKIIGSGGDYATFAAAVSALNSQGVAAGGVTFKVKSGTYNEQFRLGNITNVSATNPVIFKSQAGNRDSVTLYFAATGPSNNYVVKLDSADFVTFDSLTIQATGTSYAQVFYLLNGANNNTIKNSNLIGASTYPGNGSSNFAIINSEGTAENNTLVSGNNFSNGSQGVRIIGVSSVSKSVGTQVFNNSFNNQAWGGIGLQYQNSPVISGNTITNANSRGIEAIDCDDSLKILKNKINVSNGYGIVDYLCDGTQFGGKGLVANNFVTCGGNGGAYGIGIDQSNYQNVYYNSVNFNNTYTNQTAFYANGGGNNSVRNNILANNAGGYAYYTNTPASIGNSNYNDLYSPGSYLAFWSGNTKDLAAFKTASGMDTNSVFIYPQYLSTTDLHQSSPWIDSAGTPISSVTTDIDGDARDANKPDLGADEFTAAPSTLTPLSGTYTIGTTGNYATLNAAVNDLVLKGVSGPVVFNLQDGNYNEQVNIVSVPGASATNTITFQSPSNRSNVVIYYSATGTGNNYVVQLYGADYITFQNLTLQAIGASYARVIELAGGVDNANFQNNILVGHPSTANQNTDIIRCERYYTTNIQILGNTFSQGATGVVLLPFSSVVPSTGTRVLNDTFSTIYGGVYLETQKSAYVNSNLITVSAYSGRGIYVYDCDDTLQIQKNKINVPNNGNGILVQYCDGSQFGGKGLIANNFVTVAGNGGAAGIGIENSNYQNVYYNSVNQTNINTTQPAFYVYNGGNINVRNNVFANNGGGYAYHTTTPAAIASSDYNDLYSPGNYLAYWGTDKKDLAAFKAASLKDTNSVSIYPQFISATDLHQASPWLDSVATPISGLGGVTQDIDGQSRDANKPDMGADEFVAAPTSKNKLSGTYTIGPIFKATSPTANYPTITAAVSDLILKGISGPVTFDIQDGNFNEQISLVSIPGASATNTVTFQSLTNRNNVIIYYSATGTGNNYVVQLNGADYVTFQNLSLQAIGTSYARVIDLGGGVDNAKILNNLLIGHPTTINPYTDIIVSDRYFNTNIQIIGNTFSQGATGVVMRGLSNAVPSTGTRVLSDTFSTGYGAVYLEVNKSCYINGNVITNSVNTGRGIFVYDCDDSLQIQKNKINLPNNGTGILVQYCDGTQLGVKGLIANNFVTVGGYGGASGIGIEFSNYQNVYYNSVNLTNTYTSQAAFYVYNGGNVNVRNNIFANNGGGYAYHTTTPAAIAISDFNDLYSPGNFLAYWNANCRDLAAFKTVSSKDTNSVSIYPQFVSATDLHQASPWLDSAATPMGGLGGVTQDIDGQTRDANKPDIGADEFVAAPSSLIPLSGTYTIGSGGNYSTFTAAVNDAVLRGVSTPVTFNFLTGTYNEHVSIVNIPGANATNKVTFQSQTGNPTDVTLTYAASGAEDNYVVGFLGADYITFQKLTLQATGTSYAKVFLLWGGVDEDRILNNHLLGYSTTSNSANYTLVAHDYNISYTTNIQIIGNTLSQGGWGIVMYGLGTSLRSSGTRVLNDTFSTGYGGVYLENQMSPYINSNVITSNYRGIELNDGDDSLQIQKNKVNVTNNGFGIHLYGCDGSQLGAKGLTANNFVTNAGTGGGTGIYLEYSTYQNVYYNSVNNTNTYAAGSAAYSIYQGSNLNIVDNILASPGGGYAYYINPASAIVTSDYNDFYTSGTNLAYWNGDRTDLAALKAASGKDTNSISLNPKFISSTNLHTLQLLLDSTGTPLASVTDDIDGETRDATYPDIGADEFSCTAKAGDFNGDNKIQLTDIINLINFLFRGATAPNPICRADMNADGKVLLPDIIYLINFLFRAGPAPAKAPVCCL